MKFKRCCEGDNFVSLPKQIEVSLAKLKNTILGLSLNLINIFLTLKKRFRTIIVTLSLNKTPNGLTLDHTLKNQPLNIYPNPKIRETPNPNSKLENKTPNSLTLNPNNRI